MSENRQRAIAKEKPRIAERAKNDKTPIIPERAIFHEKPKQ